MFSKTKTDSPTSSSISTPPSPAAAPSKRPARPLAPSIVSADLTVQGTLISGGELQVDGRVEGDIRAAALVVGDNAVILGDISAEELTVRGRVEGNIRARKVQLCATCHVEGTILHEALSIEAGAFFEGSCRHSDNPLAEFPEAAARAGNSPQRPVAVATSSVIAEPARSAS